MLLTQDAQTRTGISETIMKRNYPKLYGYLKGFEARLRKRSGFKKYLSGQPFYSIYNFGRLHLAPFKIAWRDMGSMIQCGVISSKAPVCPEHHVMFVATETEDEAHYVCGVLMSSIAKLVVAGYTTTTGISTHVLEVVAVPQFKGTGPQKIIMSQSRAAHAAALSGNHGLVKKAQERLDRAAAALWGYKQDDGTSAREICDLMSRVNSTDVGTDDSEEDEE